MLLWISRGPESEKGVPLLYQALQLHSALRPMCCHETSKEYGRWDELQKLFCKCSISTHDCQSRNVFEHNFPE